MSRFESYFSVLLLSNFTRIGGDGGEEERKEKKGEAGKFEVAVFLSCLLCLTTSRFYRLQEGDWSPPDISYCLES